MLGKLEVHRGNSSARLARAERQLEGGARWSLGLRFGICKKNNDLVNNVMIVIAVLFLLATIMVTIS